MNIFKKKLPPRELWSLYRKDSVTKAVFCSLCGRTLIEYIQAHTFTAEIIMRCPKYSLFSGHTFFPVGWYEFPSHFDNRTGERIW